jgi:enamine deaminase RidA (YjgF/YER057c/UK114 family)
MGRSALHLAVTTAALIAAVHARAQSPSVVHIQQADAQYATMAIVPPGATTYYLAGMTAPVVNASAPKDSMEAYGDTRTQTIGALTVIKKALAAQKLSMGDVVMMHVFLVGDPTKGGAMDFAGMMAGYAQFFGTPDQPNKPGRTAVQVSALVDPGLLVEIEVVAAKAK